MRPGPWPGERQHPLPDAKIDDGEVSRRCLSGLRNVARAIERGHAMRTDGEIERLSETSTDSIAAAATKKGLRYVPLAALRKVTSLSGEEPPFELCSSSSTRRAVHNRESR